MSKQVKIGVLVLQGAFAEHQYSLQQCLQSHPEEFQDLELDVVKIRRPEDFQVSFYLSLILFCWPRG